MVSVKTDSIHVLIDLVRENSKVTRPVPVNQVVDFAFLEKAQRELDWIGKSSLSFTIRPIIILLFSPFLHSFLSCRIAPS